MRPSIRVGRIFGVEIGLHYSWFIIAALIMLSLSAHFHTVNPQWSSGLTWSLAAMSALFFFASVVVHELSHAAVANARGMPVKSITLFALGGVANVEAESVDAKSEFWMAIVGPISSAVIGLFFLGIARAAGWQPESGTPPAPLWAGLVWLGYINISLALFNMIPGYPLDGGRVLRSVIWSINGDRARATKLASSIGQFIAAVLVVSGVFQFLYRGSGGGLWLAVIGWFLADAAAASRASVEVAATLGHVRVADLMSQACPPVDGNVNLRTFAEDYLLRSGRRCFVVVQNGSESGLVTIKELKRIPRERWPFTTVADVVHPIEKLRTVSPDTSVVDALETMAREDLNQLSVVSNGRIVGVITREDIAQLVQTREELKAA
jgi:Zn-dependent protease